MDKSINAVLSEDMDKSAKREAFQIVVSLLGEISAQPAEQQLRCIRRDDLDLNAKLTPSGWALLLAVGFSGEGNVLQYPASRDRTLKVKLHMLETVLKGDLQPPHPPAKERPDPRTQSERDNLPDANGALQRLVAVQKLECPRILQELNQHGRKISHWIWWVCPTDMEGACDPECTCVTRQTAPNLFNSEAADDWRSVLEKLCDLVEKENSVHIVPSIDHGRIHHFLEFWKSLPAKPDWVAIVLQRLDKYEWRSTDE